jgi:soluble lytic murein transglycosylase-like protein
MFWKPRSRRAARLSTARVIAAVAALGVVTVADASHADIYKTVNKKTGVITFSNSPRGAHSRRVAKEKPKPKVFMPSDTSPERFTRYDAYIHQAATLYQIPEALVRAVIKVESDFDPRAVSHANAHGLMQLVPETAARMQVTDVYDPRQNIFGGVRYLRVLANLFNGDLELTIAAYNAGENAVIRSGGIPPYEETQDYVAKVVTYYRYYRAARLNGPR